MRTVVCIVPFVPPVMNDERLSVCTGVFCYSAGMLRGATVRTKLLGGTDGANEGRRPCVRSNVHDLLLSDSDASTF